LQCHLTEDQAPLRRPTLLHHALPTNNMSHQLPDEYWESLGPNGPFLRELFHNQLQLVMQLQAANNDLQTQVMDALGRRSQHGLPSHVGCGMNNPHQHASTYRGQSSRNAKAADQRLRWEPREDQTVCPICRIAVTMQIDAFTDERMKILYTLSFMCRGMLRSGQPMRPAQS